MCNHTYSGPQWQKYTLRSFGVVLAILLTTSMASASSMAEKDPFAKDTWHAMSPSWPGTIKFDQKKHEVRLEPMGAQVIQAKYTYTLTPANKLSKSQGGKLTMTNSLGQVSESEFLIENDKRLTLTYKSGQPSETYLRMSPAEESAEKVRLEKAIKDGFVKPLVPPQNSQK